MTITRYYTVSWDNYNGVPDDKSFYSREDAEKFFDRINVPYKKILVTTDDGEYDMKVEKDEAYYAELEEEENYIEEMLDDDCEEPELEMGFDPYDGCYTYDC